MLLSIRKALIDENLLETVIGLPEKLFYGTGIPAAILVFRKNKKYANLMYPVRSVFDWDKWQDGFDEYWRGDQHQTVRETFRTFKRQVLENFKGYRVPVIALDRNTSKEAVCVVFEKVNTGGKPLDAFELVTAMYAADGHELRKDWYGKDKEKGRHQRFLDTLRPADSESGIIGGVSNTDFLQAISLFPSSLPTISCLSN